MELDDLLATSDVVCVMAPLTDGNISLRVEAAHEKRTTSPFARSHGGRRLLSV